MISRNYNIISNSALIFVEILKNIEKLHSLLSYPLNFFILCISK